MGLRNEFIYVQCLEQFLAYQKILLFCYYIWVNLLSIPHWKKGNDSSLLQWPSTLMSAKREWRKGHR